ETAIKSPPDGYSVLVTNDNVASAPHILKLGVDYLKELVPVIQLARQPLALAAHPTLAVSSVTELIARAKQRPGLGCATSGRRVEPARAAGMVRADGGHQARPRSLSRRRPGDQRPGRRPCPRRLPRAITNLGTCACWRNRPRRAHRTCPKCRRCRKRASRAWCSRRGTPRSCPWERRRRRSRASTPRWTRRWRILRPAKACCK